MKREKLISFLGDNLAEIRGYGIKSLALFGSFARDEATDKSDVDLLVEFEGKVTFDSYMDLKFFLEDSLGCSVDIMSKEMLKPQIRDIVEREAIYVS
jgi:predicted nucleotidyltransferase